MSEHILAVIALLLLIFAFAEKDVIAATVKYDGCSIWIKGEIDTKTPQQLKRAIYLLNRHGCKGAPDAFFDHQGGPSTVYLESPGGDLVSAMALGRLIRRASLSTHVGVNHSCASACVLVELGGVIREVNGRIGLHRPYAMSYSDSLEAARAKVRQANALIAAYLTEMGIPVRLLDVMNAVPPDEIKWLDVGLDDLDNAKEVYSELEELQIAGVDPAVEDVVNSKMAEELGISKSDFYARSQRAHVVCDPIRVSATVRTEADLHAIVDKWLKCERAVLRGEKEGIIPGSR